MMKRLLMGLLMLLASGAAIAEWTDVGGNEQITLYADRSTIRRNGNFVKMWSFRDFKKAEVFGGKSNLSSRGQYEFDCKEERVRVLAYTLFSGQMLSGALIYNDSDTEKWIPVAPGSGDELLWKIACGKE